MYLAAAILGQVYFHAYWGSPIQEYWGQFPAISLYGIELVTQIIDH